MGSPTWRGTCRNGHRRSKRTKSSCADHRGTLPTNLTRFASGGPVLLTPPWRGPSASAASGTSRIRRRVRDTSRALATRRSHASPTSRERRARRSVHVPLRPERSLYQSFIAEQSRGVGPGALNASPVQTLTPRTYRPRCARDSTVRRERSRDPAAAPRRNLRGTRRGLMCDAPEPLRNRRRPSRSRTALRCFPDSDHDPHRVGRRAPREGNG